MLPNAEQQLNYIRREPTANGRTRRDEAIQSPAPTWQHGAVATVAASKSLRPNMMVWNNSRERDGVSGRYRERRWKTDIWPAQAIPPERKIMLGTGVRNPNVGQASPLVLGDLPGRTVTHGKLKCL